MARLLAYWPIALAVIAGVIMITVAFLGMQSSKNHHLEPVAFHPESKHSLDFKHWGTDWETEHHSHEDPHSPLAGDHDIHHERDSDDVDVDVEVAASGGSEGQESAAVGSSSGHFEPDTASAAAKEQAERDEPPEKPLEEAPACAYTDELMRDKPVAVWRIQAARGHDIVANIAEGHRFSGAAKHVHFGRKTPLDKHCKGLSAGYFNAPSHSRVVVPFDVKINPHQWTVAAWVRVRSLQGARFQPVVSTLSKKDDVDRGLVIFLREGANGKAAWAAGCGYGEHISALRGPLMSQGRWTHLVATFDGSFVTFYVNGKFYSGKKIDCLANEESGLLLGAGTQKGPFFHGDIFEVALYPKALTKEDISRQLLASGLVRRRTGEAAEAPSDAEEEQEQEEEEGEEEGEEGEGSDGQSEDEEDEEDVEKEEQEIAEENAAEAEEEEDGSDHTEDKASASSSASSSETASASS